MFWRVINIVGELFFLNVFNKRLCIDHLFWFCCLTTISKEFICFFLLVLLQCSFCEQFHRNNTRKFSQSEEPNWFVSGIIIWTFILLCKFSIFWTACTICSRIDGNNLSGKIPDWIGNWTKLEKLWVLYFISFICHFVHLEKFHTNSAKFSSNL